MLGPCTSLAVVPAAFAAVLNLPELVPRPNNQCSTEVRSFFLQLPQADAVGVPGGSAPWASTTGFREVGRRPTSTVDRLERISLERR